METKPSILIVEDEMIIGANIALQLNQLGYEVTGVIARAEEAVLHIKENTPQIVLVDINLKGAMDGVEMVKSIPSEIDIAVIYITANDDKTNFDRAKATNPYAFITKPFKKLDLQRAIELTSNLTSDKTLAAEKENNTDEYRLTDSIFVRNQEKMIKILINEILYIEAERNYCRIHTTSKEHLLVMTLKSINEKLPASHFVRVHRSYIINISKIKEVGSTTVVISQKAIPINKESKALLLKRLQTI